MSAADFDLVDEIERAVRAHPEKLDLLTQEQRTQAAIDIMAEKNIRYARDPWRWVREQVWTIDEASQERLRWPDKAHLRDLFDALDAYNFIAIPKSRRMMVTWAVAAYMVHKARFVPNWAGYIQSEIEDKSAYVVQERCKWIEDHLEPEPFRRRYREIKTSNGQVGYMKYEQTGSYIKAVAQGGDVLRSFTPSFLFLDESEFQPKGHEALVAAASFIEKNCKLVLVSSSNGPSGPIAELAKSIAYTRFEG